MAELSAEAKRLLVQLREVDDPTRDERASADAAVRRMLQAQGVQELPPLLEPVNTAKSLAAGSGALLKLAWVLGAALMATAGFLGVDAMRSARELAAPSRVERTPPPQVAASEEPDAEPPRNDPPMRADTPTHSAGRAVPAHTRQPLRKPGSAANDSLAAELRFLASVDADIRAGHYDRALRQLQQRKGAVSVLQEERAAMRVLALCGRNHDAHAEQERDLFLKAHPSSVLNARVRTACTGVPSP